jgi:ATP-binding cassette, subfamily B, bacterial MsbA
LRSISRAAQNNVGLLTESLTESLSAHRLVRIFDAQPYETQRFHERANTARKLEMKRVIAMGANTPIVEILAAFPLAIIFYIAIQQAIGNQTTRWLRLLLHRHDAFVPAAKAADVPE